MTNLTQHHDPRVAAMYQRLAAKKAGQSAPSRFAPQKRQRPLKERMRQEKPEPVSTAKFAHLAPDALPELPALPEPPPLTAEQTAAAILRAAAKCSRPSKPPAAPKGSLADQIVKAAAKVRRMQGTR